MAAAVTEALAAIGEAVAALEAAEGASPARLKLLRSGRALSRARDPGIGRDGEDDGDLGDDAALNMSRLRSADGEGGEDVHARRGQRQHQHHQQHQQRGLRSALKTSSARVGRFEAPTPVPFAALTPAKSGMEIDEDDEDIHDDEDNDEDDNGDQRANGENRARGARRRSRRSASPPPPPPPPPLFAAASGGGLEDGERLVLEQRVHEAEEEASRMKAFFEGVKKVNEDLQTSLQALLEAKRAHEEEIGELRDKLLAAQRHTEDAQIRLANEGGAQARQDGATIVQLRGDLERTRAEKETLESLLTKVMDSREQEELELTALRAEVQTLRRQQGAGGTLGTDASTSASSGSGGGGGGSSRLVQLSPDVSEETAAPRTDIAVGARRAPSSILTSSTGGAGPLSSSRRFYSARKDLLPTPANTRTRGRVSSDASDLTFASTGPSTRIPAAEGSAAGAAGLGGRERPAQTDMPGETQRYVERLRRDMTERRARASGSVARRQRRRSSSDSYESTIGVSTPTGSKSDGRRPWESHFTPGPLTIRKLDFATPHHQGPARAGSRQRHEYDLDSEVRDLSASKGFGSVGLGESAAASTSGGSGGSVAKLRIDSKAGTVDIEMSPRSAAATALGVGGDAASTASGSVFWTNRTPRAS